MAAPMSPATANAMQIAATLAAAIVSKRDNPTPKEAVEIWRQVFAFMQEK